MVSSDWLVMMSPNNQPFFGKANLCGRKGTRGRRRQQEEREGNRQVNDRLFATEVMI